MMRLRISAIAVTVVLATTVAMAQTSDIVRNRWVHKPTTPAYLASMGVANTANASNIALFGELTLSVTDNATNQFYDFNFTYAPNFVDMWYAGVNASNMERRFFYPNMMQGLQFVVGAPIGYSNIHDQSTLVKFTTTKTAQSSQQVAFPLVEDHSFHVVPTASSFYMNYTCTGVSPWTETFSYLFVPVATAPSSSLLSSVEHQFQAESSAPSGSKDVASMRKSYFDEQKDKHIKSLSQAHARKEDAALAMGNSSWHQCTSSTPDQLRVAAADNSSTFVVYVNRSWTLGNGSVSANAWMLALQGLVNRHISRLYFVYPPSWVWTDTEALFGFYNNPTQNPSLHFTSLCSLEDVFTVFLSSSFVDASLVPTQYVQWDTRVRQSLLNSFTIAGVDDLMVLSKEFVRVVDKASQKHRNIPLTMAHDLNGIFVNMTDLEATQWAVDRYWNRTNKDIVIWLGGEMEQQIHPGVADVGVQRRCFFAALSTSPVLNNPTTVGEYQLSEKLLGEMNPGFFLVGWHAYSKDAEHTYTDLASRSKGSVHGLNTNPNLSFGKNVPLPEGYTFKPQVQRKSQSHHKKAGLRVGLVQTDGLGLGAWTKPGRGDLPYTWEITLPDLDLQPAILRYFYENATHNDFFTAALGGPGYMYPKAVPADFLPHQLGRAQRMMDILGLKSLVIFDASDCTANKLRIQITPMSDSNIPKPIVDEYFSTVSNATGFFNGYAPSYTFEHNVRPVAQGGNQSFISFDYYVDPSRDFNDVVKDLKMLTKANPIRPYYMAIHVREFNTEARLASIFQVFEAESGVEMELLSADNFLQEASADPTFSPGVH